MKTLKLLLFTLAIIFIANFLFAGADKSGFANPPPEVRLKYPITDTVDLTGKDYLEFSWYKYYLSGRRYFEFKLYKGYQLLEANLLLKQHLPFDQYSFRVSSDKFQNGETYTWVIIQSTPERGKSDKSFQAFQVIK